MAWLFFDNEADPYQLENRLYDPDYAEVRADCESLVADFLARIGEPFASDDEEPRDPGQ